MAPHEIAGLLSLSRKQKISQFDVLPASDDRLLSVKRLIVLDKTVHFFKRNKVIAPGCYRSR
jgi:hypothetical protein